MNDVDKVGGIPMVMKALLDAGLLHGDVLTVTGRTMAENLSAIAPPDPDGKVLRAMSSPIHPTGGITILKGSLAPGGAAEPGRDMPSASPTAASVLAVYMPPQAPSPGQMARSIRSTSSRLILPARQAPTASKASMMVTS